MHGLSQLETSRKIGTNNDVEAVKSLGVSHNCNILRFLVVVKCLLLSTPRPLASHHLVGAFIPLMRLSLVRLAYLASLLYHRVQTSMSTVDFSA